MQDIIDLEVISTRGVRDGPAHPFCNERVNHNQGTSSTNSRILVPSLFLLPTLTTSKPCYPLPTLRMYSNIFYREFSEQIFWVFSSGCVTLAWHSPYLNLICNSNFNFHTFYMKQQVFLVDAPPDTNPVTTKRCWVFFLRHHLLDDKYPISNQPEMFNQTIRMWLDSYQEGKSSL